MAKKASFPIYRLNSPSNNLQGNSSVIRLAMSCYALSAVMEMQAFNGSLTVKAMRQRMAVHSLSRKNGLPPC